MTASAESISREGAQKSAHAWLVPAFADLAFMLYAAHLLRPGHAGPALACLLWAAFCFFRQAWARPGTAAALCLTGFDWVRTAVLFVSLRMQMGLPWTRLGLILGAVALFSFAAALLAAAGPGRRWFYKNVEHSRLKAAAFTLAALFFLPVFLSAKPMLPADRVLPGLGYVQALAAGLWGAHVCGLLASAKSASKTRLRIWPLFSLVFFGQFFLAAVGISIFSMSGTLHIPVPGVILGGALCRGEPGFMLFLFLFTVLLTGPAWCSHLCYFGSWDALAAGTGTPRRHQHPLLWRFISLGVIVVGALFLRFAGAPALCAAAGGIALGLLQVPVAHFLSRRRGLACYCTMVCPLGLIACLLGRLSVWRLRFTARCAGCGQCFRHCRYGALSREPLKRGQAGLSCTLCRECELSCPRGGLAVSCLGRGLPQADAPAGTAGWAGQVFVCLVSALHAAFLFMAMA